MILLAIDPGDTYSGWTLTDTHTNQPLDHAKTPNDDLLDMIRDALPGAERVVIEQVKSYGMPVGDTVFETCVWTGRFMEAAERRGLTVDRTPRLDVRLHHCHSTKAKDSNVSRALADRFAPGQPNYGKGTKDQPGWFYGFAADVWQAYALAVHWADTHQPLPAADVRTALGIEPYGTPPMIGADT